AAPASAPTSAAKKELVKKLLQLQQANFDGLSRSIVERPAIQLMQAAAQALQNQVPADKREATGKQIETDVKKFVDESSALLRERTTKLVPTTFGSGLEEKFTEDELKQFIAWTESPVNKKFQQLLPEIQTTFLQKLAADTSPVLDPKFQALQQKVRTTLTTAIGNPSAGAAAASSPAKATGK
ncbi:MAG: DUF2059 domain-containing protein, partial [Burkholderiaceae bacterium]|nr:DUF2059 domain-containing protein [Burkholderiaceae bacterium]